MSEKPDVYAVLRRAFPGLEKSDLVELAGVGRIRTYPADVVLCAEGAYENTFYVVDSGRVEVSKAFSETESRVLKEIGVGGFFGEMALIHNAPRTATVRTLEPTRVLEVEKEAFDNVLKRSTYVALTIVREVSARLRENDEMAIEDLRQKAAELAEAYQQLAEQEYARTEFLTSIAHELRTPLTAASGFLQILRAGMLDGEALSSAIETVSRSVQKVISLVNDLLFLQEMDIILSDFVVMDLGAVVASGVEKIREKAYENGVGIELNLDPNLPRISGDPESLTRAFLAILDNAVKFSSGGGEVRVTLRRADGGAIFEVQDEGVGIAPEAITRIFDRFYRIERIGDRLFGGLGLGLAIAKDVVGKHNGRIEVESEPGTGSTFSVWLPATPAAG